MKTVRPNLDRRGGTILVAVLVCLLVVTGILAAMLQGTLRARRQLRVERDLRQTQLLLRAGASRAAAKLWRDPSYRGETWKLPAEAIVGSGDGQVTIDVLPVQQNESWQVEVVAEYPFGDDSSIRRSHTYRIDSQPPVKE